MEIIIERTINKKKSVHSKIHISCQKVKKPSGEAELQHRDSPATSIYT